MWIHLSYAFFDCNTAISLLLQKLDLHQQCELSILNTHRSDSVVCATTEIDLYCSCKKTVEIFTRNWCKYFDLQTATTVCRLLHQMFVDVTGSSFCWIRSKLICALLFGFLLFYYYSQFNFIEPLKQQHIVVLNLINLNTERERET